MILGLDEITFAELRSSKKLVEALRAKIGDLNPQKLTDQELSRKVNFLIEILRETLMDRYQALSLRAFAHMVVALDYFLSLDEHEPGSIKDTYENGYVDDLQRMNAVFTRFSREIKAFEDWRARQPKD
jgi:hypothetical protein